MVRRWFIRFGWPFWAVLFEMPYFMAFETPSFFVELGTFGLFLRVLFLNLGGVNLHRYYIIILFAMSRFGWDVRAPLGLFGAKMIVSFWS
jgi:hypothetical protein